MGFPTQEHWSGLLFLSPGDFHDPGIETASPALAGRFYFIFTTKPRGKPTYEKKKATKKWRASSQMSFPGGSVVSRIRLGNKTTINSQTETVHLSVA